MRLFILITFLSTLLISCSKSKLDLYPEINLTDGNFYTSEQQMTQAVNDVYRNLGINYDVAGIADIYGELFSDNVYIKLTSGANSFPQEINRHQIMTNNGLLEAAWNKAYTSLYIINNIIEKLENTNIEFSNTTLKERLIAESKTIRALIYFNLIQAWGDVPFALKVITPAESYNYIRVSKDEISGQLITDLVAAKSILPESYTGADIGRVTKYGAAAILSKIYLFRKENEKAKTELEAIINSNVYSLDANSDGAINTNDYAHLFKADTKNSRESLVEAQYLAGQNNVNSHHQTDYAPWDFAFHLPGNAVTFRGTGLNTPTEDLINEYETNDPRKDLTLQSGFNDLQTGNFINYPYTIKFYDPNYLYAGQNVEIIRYADILLLYAELANDATYLNQVRSRVGLPGFGNAGYPSAKYPTLKLAIEHERRVELAFEFHRFFDLVRTGRAIEVLGAKGINTTENRLLFPIPQAVIDVNNKITQNPQ